MEYTRPTIADYGDVAQLTADQQNRNAADQIIGVGEVLGNLQQPTGQCQTGILRGRRWHLHPDRPG